MSRIGHVLAGKAPVCPGSGKDANSRDATDYGFAGTVVRAKCPECKTDLALKLDGTYRRHRIP